MGRVTKKSHLTNTSDITGLKNNMRIYFFLSKSSPNSYHETTNKKLDQFLGSYLTMSWDFVIIKFNNQIFPRNILV